MPYEVRGRIIGSTKLSLSTWDKIVWMRAMTSPRVSEDYSFPGRKPSKQLQFAALNFADAVSRACFAPTDRPRLVQQFHWCIYREDGFIEAYHCMLREVFFVSPWGGNSKSVHELNSETAVRCSFCERLLPFNSGPCQATLIDCFLANFTVGSLARFVIKPSSCFFLTAATQHM